MQVKVSLVVKNHLNDAIMEMGYNPELAQERLQFVKYLVHHYSNTEQEIMVDLIYEQFQNLN